MSGENVDVDDSTGLRTPRRPTVSDDEKWASTPLGSWTSVPGEYQQAEIDRDRYRAALEKIAARGQREPDTNAAFHRCCHEARRALLKGADDA